MSKEKISFDEFYKKYNARLAEYPDEFFVRAYEELEFYNEKTALPRGRGCFRELGNERIKMLRETLGEEFQNCTTSDIIDDISYEISRRWYNEKMNVFPLSFLVEKS